MTALRKQWKTLLVVVVVSAIGIFVFEPDYNKLQGAKDAAAFRNLLDAPGRAVAATLCDVVFAISYGLLGVVGMRVHGGRGRWATVGVVAIAVGALADLIENKIVLASIIGRRTLTDGWIDAIHIPGTIKWVATPAFLALFVLLIRRATAGNRD